MKAINLFVLGSAVLFISCDNSESTETDSEVNLEKIVTLFTTTNDPSYNTKNIRHFVNNQVVSDSTFNNENQFIARNVITVEGLTKIYKTYSNTGELTAHKDENYDSEGRLTGRHTYIPTSALFFTYVYNDDGTVTSNAFNVLDNQTTVFRTFTKNASGLIYKENGSGFNPTTNLMVAYENNATYQNQKMISTNQSGTITTFQYYPNPMPENIQKSANELNNLIVLGNELRYLAYRGNSYYKANDDDIMTFNNDNYKTYFKTVSTNTAVTPNITNTTEQFYYYE
ncbi:hypothetical protein [Flavobacterium sp.]|uniref:hypothetical protein n=1 Tax=Flavobacterium sp. TaxID=239 RepID=UPI00248A4720|nr:hypothetical protein [Flavobacterium sp.]MDI1318226.1 hypothetical protein [Flavobacterium sp.]